MSFAHRLILGSAAIVLLAHGASAAPLPTRVGQCGEARIAEIAGRLQGDDDFSSGTGVAFDNKGYQVSYERIEPIIQSKVGDQVRICLVSIPHGCPRGDTRGKVYKTTNLRTNQSWTLPDSEHMCGGA